MKIYNPLNENFTTTYDTNGDGNPLRYTLHAQEIESFDDPIAKHLAHHLAHKIAQKNHGKGTYEMAYEKAYKQITDLGDLQV
jgi:hypothetical protein